MVPLFDLVLFEVDIPLPVVPSGMLGQGLVEMPTSSSDAAML